MNYRKKVVCSEAVRSEVTALVEMGQGLGGTKVSGKDRAAILGNLRRALASSIRCR